MTLDNRHMAGSLLMLAAAIGYNVWVFAGPASRPGAAAAPIDIAAAASPGGEMGDRGTAVAALDVPALPDVALDRLPEWRRDPFEDLHEAPPVEEAAPAAPPPVVEADPVVASILYSTGRRLAVIDGRIVRLRDRVGNATVVDILPKAVILEFGDGDRRTVALEARSTAKIQRPASNARSTPNAHTPADVAVGSRTLDVGRLRGGRE